MPEPTPANPMKILLVDDHRDTATITRMLLEKNGMEVRVAESAKEAMQLADAENFDLLITDINLPDGDGFTLGRQLRDKYGFKSISLSGRTIEDEGHEFDAHLTKPIEIEKLLAVIRRVMNKAM
jgi:two-component system, chemotaxis family, CheB/CheR fusion protein